MAWAQILEAQRFVRPGFEVLHPGFAMEKLPRETLGANPRSPTSFGLSAWPGSAVAKPGFAVEKLPRETIGANPRSLASFGLGFGTSADLTLALPSGQNGQVATGAKKCSR